MELRGVVHLSECQRPELPFPGMSPTPSPLPFRVRCSRPQEVFAHAWWRASRVLTEFRKYTRGGRSNSACSVNIFDPLCCAMPGPEPPKISQGVRVSGDRGVRPLDDLCPIMLILDGPQELLLLLLGQPRPRWWMRRVIYACDCRAIITLANSQHAKELFAMTERHPCGRQGAVAPHRIRVISSDSLGLATGFLQLAHNDQALLAQRFHASGVSCRLYLAHKSSPTQDSPQRRFSVATGDSHVMRIGDASAAARRRS